MNFSARQIAEFLKGSIDGNPEVLVNRIEKIEEAREGALTFLSNPAYTPHIYKTGASIVLVRENFLAEQPLSCTLIRVPDPYNALASLLELYQKSLPRKKGISSLAFIEEDVELGKDVYIGPFVHIGKGARIGDNCLIHSHVSIGEQVEIGSDCLIFSGVIIYENCRIGNQCTLHANAVIGADGFGFAPQQDNQYRKVAQIGNVVIEDQVEIGAGTCIDRATLGSTIIRKGVKLDNLIQIAHNVIIGRNTVIAALTGVAGSAHIGENCMIGGQVGINGHLQVGNEVKIAAQTGVSSSVKDGMIIMGAPAMDAGKFRKAFIHFRNFEKLVGRIDQLEKQLAELKPLKDNE